MSQVIKHSYPDGTLNQVAYACSRDDLELFIGLFRDKVNTETMMYQHNHATYRVIDHIAADDSVKILGWLMQNYPDMKYMESIVDSKGVNSRSTLIQQAAKHNKTGVIQMAIDAGFDPDFSAGDDHPAAIYEAIKYDALNSFMLLAKEDDYKANSRIKNSNSMSWNLLHYAVDSNAAKIIKHILKHGVDLLYEVDNSQYSPLLHAISENKDDKKDFIPLLIKAFDYSKLNGEVTTPQQAAARHKNGREYLRLMHEKGWDMNATSKSNDVTPFLYAILYSNVGAVEFLSDFEPDLQATYRGKENAYDLAIKTKNDGIISLVEDVMLRSQIRAVMP